MARSRPGGPCPKPSQSPKPDPIYWQKVQFQGRPLLGPGTALLGCSALQPRSSALGFSQAPTAKLRRLQALLPILSLQPQQCVLSLSFPTSQSIKGAPEPLSALPSPGLGRGQGCVHLPLGEPSVVLTGTEASVHCCWGRVGAAPFPTCLSSELFPGRKWPETAGQAFCSPPPDLTAALPQANAWPPQSRPSEPRCGRSPGLTLHLLFASPSPLPLHCLHLPPVSK